MSSRPAPSMPPPRCSRGSAPRLDAVETGPWRRHQPLTAIFNVTGHPAICVPGGFAANGLPLSVQLAGRFFDEARLLRIAHAYEQEAAWYRKRPTLATLG